MIERVYIGLPSHLDVFWVGRKYRTHPWSHIPGGYDVVVEYHQDVKRYRKKVLGYDWIKIPHAYIEKFFYGEIIDLINFNILDYSGQLSIVKNAVSTVYSRYYGNDEDYQNNKFQEVWNCQTSDDLPWESLEKFRNKIEKQLKSQEEFSSEDYEWEDDGFNLLDNIPF